MRGREGKEGAVKEEWSESVRGEIIGWSGAGERKGSERGHGKKRKRRKG